MSKFFSKLPTQAVSLFALLLASLPVSAKAELTSDEMTDAFYRALVSWGEHVSYDGFFPSTIPLDDDLVPLYQYIDQGLFDGAGYGRGGTPWLQDIYFLLTHSIFTNDLGEVVNGLDVLTNQLTSIDRYSSAISLKTDFISEDVTYINHSFQDLYLEFLATLHRTDYSTDGQNVWVMNPDEIGEEVGSAVGSTIGSELSLATSKLDEIISRLTPTNHIDISAEEVNYLDQDDFIDTSDALSETPYDYTSYSSPTNTDHFAGIGNPSLLDLPDPTSKLNDLSTSVQNLPQNDEIVFWDGESGTSADALGKVSVRLGEQGMVQTSGNVFVFAWNLLYAIFSGLAVWRFVLNVHPTQNQMQGKLF